MNFAEALHFRNDAAVAAGMAKGLAGIRVTRTQFARMMGCSRQAVTGPARLLAKLLESLLRDIGAKDYCIAQPSAQLKVSQENAKFHEGGRGGLNGRHHP